MTEDRTEGWGAIRPGDRKAHYYRDMTSLCRRVGFYQGPLDPDDKPSPDDHAECRRLLDREISTCAAVVEMLVQRDSNREPVKFRDELAQAIQAEGGAGAVLAAARDLAKHKPGSLQAAIGDVLIVRYNKGGWVERTPGVSSQEGTPS